MEDINKLKINFACQLNHSSDYDTVRQLCETYSYENHSIWRIKTGKLKWLLVSRRSFAASVGFLAMVIPGYPQVSLFRFLFVSRLVISHRQFLLRILPRTRHRCISKQVSDTPYTFHFRQLVRKHCMWNNRI